MSLGGHDMRLLSAACVAWAALATLLSARPDPAIVVVVLVLAAITAAIARASRRRWPAACARWRSAPGTTTACT